MYIEKIEIENFRIFGEKTEIVFQNGLNMLIGENNSGKTAVIDAIRLVLNLGTYKRNLYMDENDFHIDEYGRRSKNAKISIYFNELTRNQKADLVYLSNIIDESSCKAEIHVNYFSYFTNKGEFRVSEEILGYNNQSIPDKECLRKLTSIYMPALRNAESDMKPSKYSQLSHLLLKFADTQEKRENLVKIVSDMNDLILQDNTVSKMQESINDNLKMIEKEIINQKINISMSETTINDIGATLKLTNKKELNKIYISDEEKNMISREQQIDIEKYTEKVDDATYILDIQKMKNDKIELADSLKSKIEVNYLIRQNGLGYNNILSMATELGNLKEANTDDFVIMLLEEPEAHLHPQLLYLLNDFI
ncbi:MAG: ATP-dependent nuclease [Clostridia bacterium]